MASRDFLKGLLKGDRSLMGLESLETRFSEDEILELGKKLNWIGKGTIEEPLIIPNEKGLPHKFSISIMNIHLKIINNSIEHLILGKSQNILIEGCSFEKLGIFYSSKITIKNSKLSHLTLEKGSNSYFKDCLIERAENLRSQGNVFEDCQMNSKVKKELIQGFFNLPKNTKYWPIPVGIFGFGIIFFTAIYIINSLPFSLYWYLSIPLFFLMIVVFRFVSKQQQKTVPNKIISKEDLNKNFEFKKKE